MRGFVTLIPRNYYHHRYHACIATCIMIGNLISPIISTGIIFIISIVCSRLQVFSRTCKIIDIFLILHNQIPSIISIFTMNEFPLLLAALLRLFIISNPHNHHSHYYRHSYSLFRFSSFTQRAPMKCVSSFIQQPITCVFQGELAGAYSLANQ